MKYKSYVEYMDAKLNIAEKNNDEKDAQISIDVKVFWFIVIVSDLLYCVWEYTNNGFSLKMLVYILIIPIIAMLIVCSLFLSGCFVFGLLTLLLRAVKISLIEIKKFSIKIFVLTKKLLSDLFKKYKQEWFKYTLLLILSVIAICLLKIAF